MNNSACVLTYVLIVTGLPYSAAFLRGHGHLRFHCSLQTNYKQIIIFQHYISFFFFTFLGQLVKLLDVIFLDFFLQVCMQDNGFSYDIFIHVYYFILHLSISFAPCPSLQLTGPDFSQMFFLCLLVMMRFRILSQ